MPTAIDCKYYIEGGKCGDRDAPNPGQSWCIGKDDCYSYAIADRKTAISSVRATPSRHRPGRSIGSVAGRKGEGGIQKWTAWYDR